LGVIILLFRTFLTASLDSILLVKCIKSDRITSTLSIVGLSRKIYNVRAWSLGLLLVICSITSPYDYHHQCFCA